MVHKKRKNPSWDSGYRVTNKKSQMYTVCFFIFIIPFNCKLVSFFVYSPNSAIDGNVEFVHTQYSCILTSQVSTKFDVSEKNINNSDHFRIKCLSDSKISGILCALYFLFFTLFYFILENKSTNVRKFCFPYYIWHLWRRV